MSNSAAIARLSSPARPDGLSRRAEDFPQNNACTGVPLSLEAEDWGEGEHTALVVLKRQPALPFSFYLGDLLIFLFPITLCFFRFLLKQLFLIHFKEREIDNGGNAG